MYSKYTPSTQPIGNAHVNLTECKRITFISPHREQKTLDLENRARYTALQKRWEVLDKTITIPDDDLSYSGQEYLEHSDGEDEDDGKDHAQGWHTLLNFSL